MLHVVKLIERRFPALPVKPGRVLVAASALLAATGAALAILR